MTDRLSLYNDALLMVGERFLASLTENREPRYLLDQAWNSNGVQECLEMAPWKFAIRAQRIDFDPDATPLFGLRYRFNKPADWVQTWAIDQDEFYTTPLLAYEDEVDFWYADITPIFVRFVSNDNNYGLAFGRWPQTFATYVAAHLAGKIILKLTTDQTRRDYILHPKEGLEARKLLTAKSKDALGAPTRFFAQGKWVTARRTRSHRDLGNRGQLLGG